MFIDRVYVKLFGGKGGNGVVAWRREKFVPKGGPTGGNGGRGGSIIIEGDTQISSLDHLRNNTIIKAESGGAGGANQCQGKTGKDLILKVPCGTLVKEAGTHRILCDITEPGQRWVACKGGHGGRGNASFRTSTHQAPNWCKPGAPGEVLDVDLELKLIADIGLVGLPNAGKSTLINALTNLPAKTGAYPFTTLRPNLGHMRNDDGSRLLIADIPGIIEGAHQDRGLGFEFLRHIERTKALIFVLDASGIEGRSPWDDYQTLRHELQQYEAALLDKPLFLCLNKSDVEESAAHIADFRRHYTGQVFVISAFTGDGLEVLQEALVLGIPSPDPCSGSELPENPQV